MEGLISISVVSHGQFGLVKNLLDDLEKYCSELNFELILTLNLPEHVELCSYRFPVHIISNEHVKGFGENHNAAFAVAEGDFFCVVNPDVRLTNNVFDALLPFHIEKDAGLTAPVVSNSAGELEDSARRFPSPLSIGLKVLGLTRRAEKLSNSFSSSPDWVAGMFMLFNSAEYKALGGFDERYFLYYEDVDICARLALKGRSVLMCQTANVIHDAQRSSHKSFKYLRWHLSSMLRFFFSINYLRLLCRSL